MDYKQAIIDNAWWGISMDYGLLHLQLATPVAVLVILFIMIFTLNKLLFQPVLRTLDNRKSLVNRSEKRVSQVSGEIERLKQEFRQKLDLARADVLHLRNVGHEEGVSVREDMISRERQELHAELDKNYLELEGEIEAAKVRFATLNEELSASISQRLLS